MTWIIKGSIYDAKRGPRIRRHKETSWLLSDVSLGTGEQSRVDRWVYYLRSPRTKFHLSYDSAIVRLLSSSPCCSCLSTTMFAFQPLGMGRSKQRRGSLILMTQPGSCTHLFSSHPEPSDKGGWKHPQLCGLVSCRNSWDSVIKNKDQNGYQETISLSKSAVVSLMRRDEIWILTG